ncbi:hypothetical protein BDD14_4886 [Edaphobacter modestus]|uniref:Uncharacterized protein n=1 Tax=Edaphobacter modestus TaxID=388466 RepID=A0A4Q7Z096_9BACT|nr:hypothetical protein BDD14_4886 [Edaphobacter modestus]
MKLFAYLTHDRLFGYTPSILDIHTELVEFLSWDVMALQEFLQDFDLLIEMFHELTSRRCNPLADLVHVNLRLGRFARFRVLRALYKLEIVNKDAEALKVCFRNMKIDLVSVRGDSAHCPNGLSVTDRDFVTNLDGGGVIMDGFTFRLLGECFNKAFFDTNRRLSFRWRFSFGCHMSSLALDAM